MPPTPPQRAVEAPEPRPPARRADPDRRWSGPRFAPLPGLALAALLAASPATAQPDLETPQASATGVSTSEAFPAASFFRQLGLGAAFGLGCIGGCDHSIAPTLMLHVGWYPWSRGGIEFRMVASGKEGGTFDPRQVPEVPNPSRGFYVVGGTTYELALVGRTGALEVWVAPGWWVGGLAANAKGRSDTPSSCDSIATPFGPLAVCDYPTVTWKEDGPTAAGPSIAVGLRLRLGRFFTLGFEAREVFAPTVRLERLGLSGSPGGVLLGFSLGARVGGPGNGEAP